MKEWFKKYNVAGPRYTSYPTVPYWETNPTHEQWVTALAQELERGKRSNTGAAIYIHIPFCKSLCTYCGCNTRITRRADVGRPYVESVLQEWKLYRQALGVSSLPVTEIHLGGGTPTFLNSDDLSFLLDGLLSFVQPTSSFEFSLEADPRVTSRQQLETLSRFGFRRLSLGIQDFDPTVQEAVNRVQTEEEVGEISKAARELGYNSLNFDLIYGLPFQTLKSIESTFDSIRNLRPDRIAFYGYAHVPWIKPSHRKFSEADLPSGDAKRALYEKGRELLESAGYREVGLDHFALETDSLWKAVKEKTLHRNFMGYTSRSVFPLIGLGVSSISDAWSAFAQNEKVLEKYQERVKNGEIPIHRGHLLTEEDQVIRQHVLNLMTRFETSWSSTELNTAHLSTASERLKELANDRLVEVGSNYCKVTEAGRPFLRNICMAFDARLIRKAPTTELFSKTI